MAASKLSIYNAALGHLGERKLASLAENREPRRVLDDFYTQVVGYALERAPWDFALRLLQVDASGSVTPEFGYTNAFDKPSDWSRTHKISDSPKLDAPPMDFKEERDRWYADADPIYVQYVSNSATLGGFDLGRWTEAFEDYVTLRLALKCAPRITGNKAEVSDLIKLSKIALKEARELNRSGDHPEQPPMGTWASSRSGGNTNRSRWDRRSF